MATRSRISVDIENASGATDVPGDAEIADWVRAAIAASGIAVSGRREVAVRIVTEAEIRALNARFRQRDAATNVLSFPAGAVAGLPAEQAGPLGDIVICAAVVTAEAAVQGKAAAAHWGHMLVHGTLHLLGFDHETEAEATAMERVETGVLGSRGIANPYSSE